MNVVRKKPLQKFYANPLVPPPGPRPTCDCLRHHNLPVLHDKEQDTSCGAWKRVRENVKLAIRDGRERFDPLAGLSGTERRHVITLPDSIEHLVRVKIIQLYASHLVRIPPQIGGMSSLAFLDIYTSDCLHFLPFEVTRCKDLRGSRASSRCLYGNYKHRPHFPDLAQAANTAALARLTPSCCSVCQAPLETARSVHRWITLRVGTDDFPLLVNGCSMRCIEALPTAPAGYVRAPHSGGTDVVQPPPSNVPGRSPGLPS